MKVKRLCLSALFGALICLGGMISLPIGPVPVCLALVMVFFAALYLPGLCGLAATAVYVLLGGIGLPVFSGIQGGIQVLLGPTGGYIVGYLLIPVAVWLFRKLWKKGGLPGCVLGLLVCYASGTVQYSFVTGTPFWAALPVCVIPFIPLDAVKIAAAYGLCKVLPRIR